MATDVKAQPVPEQARAAAVALHAHVTDATGVALPVRLWDGTTLGPSDRGYRLVLPHPWSARALLWPPNDETPGRAYASGAVDLEGDAVAALAEARALTAQQLRFGDRLRLLRLLNSLPAPPERPSIRRARLSGRRHSRARDRAAIAFHYDLTQAFYETFLDEQLVYSCAYFRRPGEDLETAQVRKLELVCRKLRVTEDTRLLDIGCGWGSLLLHAASRHGARGLGVTLSRTQYEEACRRIEVAGVANRVEVRLQDYRDLDGSFDAVASIGMFEHVGPDQLPTYFATAHRLTAPGGLFLNHGIVTGHFDRVRTGHERDFASAAVFPDGGLVPPWRAVRELQRPGFELIDVEQLRPHYVLTLRRWVARLERNHDAAVEAASEEAYRTWRVYMAGSACGFASGDLGVVQVLGRRTGPASERLPLTREWMLVPS